MEREEVARFDAIVNGARLNGWDERRGFGEFMACLADWLTDGPMHLNANEVLLRILCETLLDPKAGPLKGGHGFEYLDFTGFNRARGRLFELYNIPAPRFSALLS